MPVLVDYFRKKQINDLVIASPDVGFSKQASPSSPRRCAVSSPVIGYKVRQATTTSERPCWTSSASVEGKNVLIVDDFTITGGTLDRDGQGPVSSQRCQGHLCVRLARES